MVGQQTTMCVADPHREISIKAEPASQIIFISWPQVYNPNPGVLQGFTRVTLLEKLNINNLSDRFVFFKKSLSNIYWKMVKKNAP